MQFLLHCFLILIAYAVATFAAGVTIGISALIVNTGWQAVIGAFASLSALTDVFATAVFFWLFLIFWFALIPFLIAIVIAEIFNIRSRLAYLLFGGALGIASVFLSADFLPWLKSGSGGALINVIAGAVAGLVYWLVAGRRTGAWKQA